MVIQYNIRMEAGKMPLSDAKKRANRKWDAANLVKIAANLRKDAAEDLKEKAAEHNTNISALILRWARAYLAGWDGVPRDADGHQVED